MGLKLHIKKYGKQNCRFLKDGRSKVYFNLKLLKSVWDLGSHIVYVTFE